MKSKGCSILFNGKSVKVAKYETNDDGNRRIIRIGKDH